MVIDEVMPRWDVRSRHEISVRAAPERVFEAIQTADFAEHPLVRGMLSLRALPIALRKNGVAELRERSRKPVTLAEFERRGFRVVAVAPPRELVMGLEGIFWSAGGALRPVTRESFTHPVPRGLARAAWSFSVVAASETESTLITETRVASGDASARRRFRIYWTFVGWGSGLIRRLILRSIKTEAERSTRLPVP
jgi:hypothetical protein